MLADDNPNSRIWLDVAIDRLTELADNPEKQVTEEHSRAIRTFYSLSLIAQYALFGKELTNRIYDLNGRLSL